MIAGLVFAVLAAGVVAFQVGLALGAPWGEYAMGGTMPGRFPPAMRVAALVQAALVSLLALAVLSVAGIAMPAIAAAVPWVGWLAVVFAAVSLILNAISRSAGERRLWVPVAVGMLASSLLVAIAA